MEERKRASKWGAACASCAAAKAKCIRRPDGNAQCERCERLLKDCTSQTHRPRKKRTCKPSKTAQLEQRLNGLVDLLRASGEIPLLTEPGTPPLTTAGGSQAQDGPEASASTSPSRSLRSSRSSRPSPSSSFRPGEQVKQRHLAAPPPPLPNTPGPLATPTTTPRPPACICRLETAEPWTGVVEGEETLLARYREHMFPLFPFVAVPPDSTPETLAADRPFLFLAIKTVASMDNVRSMQSQMVRIMVHVSECMLLRSERSLDLLQGLMVIISWYQHHCMMHAQMHNLVHLATSLLADLGLTRPPRLAERIQLMALHPSEPTPRTNEERRATLGIWYISSCTALCFQKTDPMRFSPYVRQCLQELEKAPDRESDAVVVALVRLQHISQKVAASSNADDLDSFAPLPSAPLSAHLALMQNELDRIVALSSPEAKNHAMVRIHIVSASLRLYEPPPVTVAMLQKLAADLALSSPACKPSALDMLYRSHSALTAWFDEYFSVPVNLHQWLPLPFGLLMMYALTMAGRWARLFGPMPPTEGSTQRWPHPAPAAAVKTALPFPQQPPNLPNMAMRPHDVASAIPEASLMPGARGTAPPTASSSTPPTTAPPGPGAKDSGEAGLLMAAKTTLRDMLRSQADLVVDIRSLLFSLRERIDQVNREQRLAAAAKFGEGVRRVASIWDLTSYKISVIAFKFDRAAAAAAAAATTTATMATTPATASGSCGHSSTLACPSSDDTGLNRPDGELAKSGPSRPSDPFSYLGQGPTDMDLMGDTSTASVPSMAAAAAAGGQGPGMNGLPGWDDNSLWTTDMFENFNSDLWLNDMSWIESVDVASLIL